MGPYEYRSLEALHGEIRLVRLLPGVFRDGIRIEIFHAQLHIGSCYEPRSSEEDVSNIGSLVRALADLELSDEEASWGQSRPLTERARSSTSLLEEPVLPEIPGLRTAEERCASQIGHEQVSSDSEVSNGGRFSSEYERESEESGIRKTRISYEALSYVWGPITDLHTIKVLKSSPKRSSTSHSESHTPKASTDFDFVTLQNHSKFSCSTPSLT